MAKKKKNNPKREKSFEAINTKLDVKEGYKFVWIKHTDGTTSICRSTLQNEGDVIVLENDYKTLPAWTRKIGGQSLSKEKEFSNKYKDIDWNI